MEKKTDNPAPGAPGQPTSWTSGAKSGLGKAINAASEVTFTLGKGIINEVYFPREDIACIRQMGLIITDRTGWMTEEKTGTLHRERMLSPGIPAYRVVNTCREKKFTIRKEIIADPLRDTLLQRIRFSPRKKEEGFYSLYVMVYPHIRNEGMENKGWTGDYHGMPMLFAGHDDIVLALACSQPWLKMSCGFAGVSDGLSDIGQHGTMNWQYDRAETGSIVLTAQIDLSGDKELVLALGFGSSAAGAGHQARSSLMEGFDRSLDRYVKEWKDWQHSLKESGGDYGGRRGGRGGNYFRESAAVLRMSESKRCPGGIIASLAIPWGESKHDNALGGYHLVWPRDLAETSWGFLSMGSQEEVLRILNYLMSTQQPDGSWSQNMWLDGDPYFKGLQMDEIALPLLLIDTCQHAHILEKERLDRYWPGIRKALSFLIVHGPYSPEDRWEQQGGLSPFTLAAEIAALLAAAGLAELNGEHDLAHYCRDTADAWNDQIEEWTYVTGTRNAEARGIEGYYVRVNPFYAPIAEVKDRTLTIKHHVGDGKIVVGDVVCADALALVRFGLRAADDPRILNTVRMIDEDLKTETPQGPCWRRFTGDAYGEDAYGHPFVDKGIGRSWPLLTGERAHYEIAAGNFEKARKLMKTMESFSSNGLFSEQVWDRPDIPAMNLFRGKPTGSAMPLTWAHAEYLKLAASLKMKRVFDRPRHTVKRYLEQKKASPFCIWRFDRMCASLREGKTLRIELLAPAIVHWSADGWNSSQDIPTRDTGAGIYLADIPPVPDFPSTPGSPPAPVGRSILFTFYWKESNKWENKNFRVAVGASRSRGAGHCI